MNTFEVTIHPKVGSGLEGYWPVVSIYSPPSVRLPIEARGELLLNEGDLEGLRRLLGQPKEYGTYLGKCLFQGPIERAFTNALQENQERLRVLLSIEAEDRELRTLRWERLCAPIDAYDNWDFLRYNQRVPFSLYILSVAERRFPPIGRQNWRVLLLVASPEEPELYPFLVPFNVKAAIESVRSGLEKKTPCDILAYQVEGAVGLPTLDQLSEQLSKQSYTVLHIVCHGKVNKEKETVLYWAKAGNRVEAVLGKDLVERLQRVQGPRGLPHLAFLCTCESASKDAESAFGGLGDILVRDLGMPAVVAMTERVTVETALALNTKFYQRLKDHGEVDLALVEAMAGLGRREDIVVPALFSRLGGRPLFSDSLDRELNSEEIRDGLERFRKLLEVRAPVLMKEFDQQATLLGKTLQIEVSDLPALSQESRKERQGALDEVNALSNEVLGFSFNAVALNKSIPEYDPHCPFRGLSHFRYEDRKFFFGREKLVETLKSKLEEQGFLAVLGDSGSGKSSIVFAGLLPALRNDEPDPQMDLPPDRNPLVQLQTSLTKIQVAYMIPNANPVEQLRTSLAAVQGLPSVLIVDQFEEVFTLCKDEKERRAFIDQLLRNVQQQRVVITMRADFWGACAPYHELKELIQKGQELIASLDPKELRDAIERQARLVGLRFEAGLSNAIFADVQQEPGAMPLVQYALQELWKRRHGWLLLHKEYEIVGKVQEAISTTAERFYNGLSQENRVRVRYIFEQLTHVDEDDLVQGRKPRDTRQRVKIGKLVPPGESLQQIEDLVDRLAGEEARLVVTSWDNVTNEKMVEVAHEALILHWQRLQRWLNESRANLRLQQQIEREAREWEEAGKEEDRLRLQGGLLRAALELGQKVTLDEHANAYMKACQDLQEKREVETKTQLITALSALSEAHFKDDQLGAFIHILKAGRLLQQVKKESPWLKEEVRIRTQVVLLQTLGRVKEWNRLEGHKGRVQTIAYSPNGREIATVGVAYGPNGGEVGSLYLWNPNGTLLPSPEIAGILSVTFSRDGRMMALGGGNGFLLWQRESNELREVPSNAVNAIAFRHDGGMIVTGEGIFTASIKNPTGIVKLWKSDGTLLRNLEGLGSVMMSVAFSPDGQLIVAGGWWGAWGLWKSDGTLVKAQGSHDGSLNAVDFSPDSEMFITAGNDGRALLWKRVGEELRSLQDPRLNQGKAHSDAIWGARFSPDGKLIATVSNDRTVKLWKSDGGLLATLEGHRSVVRTVDFSSDSQILASASDDGTVKLWKLGGTALKILVDHADEVYIVRFSPDGKLIATASGHGWVRYWKPDGMLLRTERLHHGPISTLEFGPKGMMATASGDRSVKLWNANGSLLKELDGHEGEVLSISFSPRSDMIATGGVDGVIKLWDAEGTFVRDLGKHEYVIRGVRFSPDGELIASVSDDGTVKLWNKSTSFVKTLAGGSVPFTDVTFSPDSAPDDQIIAAASVDGTVRLWRRDGVELSLLEGHGDVVRAVCFSPNGQLIATASYDRTVKIWTRDSVLQRTLYGHLDLVNAVAFSPDGKTLASASNDTTVILWNLDQALDLDDLISYGCDWVRDYLEHNPHVNESDRDLILKGVWAGVM